MLRISVDDSPEGITLRLDGKVNGPWVEEVARTWEAVRARPERKPVSLDLRHVSFVDEAGTRLIEAMGRQGVETLWGGPWLRSALFAHPEKRRKSRAARNRKGREADVAARFHQRREVDTSETETPPAGHAPGPYDETSPQKPFAI